MACTYYFKFDRTCSTPIGKIALKIFFTGRTIKTGTGGGGYGPAIKEKRIIKR